MEQSTNLDFIQDGANQLSAKDKISQLLKEHDLL
jgi:hypothetical protein